ncbi:unnamed protein product [Linum tenue]|uniref:non-specific serine/threonine protein kinase n=1 Tax=Linum tenue TaxID=586396 RepID=A0AAV0QTJ7_9ROSI|nr:unnamed protein product [Linum tenue]
MEASFFSLLSKTPSQLFRNFQALILLISILLLLWPSSSSLSVAAAAAAVNLEAEALLTWKATLQNQHQFNYHPLSSWSAQTSPCAWFGIFCNNQGSIANITLVGTGLKATLEVFSFSSFPNLVSLNLQNNSLYGPIPSHIANLSKLSFLDLSLNGFYGSIPSEIGSLVRLSSLSFTSNNLNGSIPTSFANLTQLLSLGLDRNQLSGYIPQEIGKLASLTTLDFTLNKITGPIQAGIGNLTNLSILRLGWNNLYGPIPEELGLLRGLVKLDLSTNNLTGEIPAYLGNLTLLDNLFLSSNKLSGNIPSELGKLTSLSDFQLYTNRLTGPIPPSIGNLSRLNMLAFSGNQLSGSIPEEIGMMRSLIVINLNTNVLTGSIPASIANIPNISYIGFAGNRLSGIVPVEFSNLTFLQGFDVPANKLTGSLPPDICIGGVLKVFTAYNNSLTGPIPRSLKNCSTLTRLRLEKNQLTGNISQDLGVYPDLNYADLSDNKLQGELRSWNWGSLYNLSTLKLARNNISGEIPAEVGKAPHLNLLDLSSNRLTGLIPGELSQLRLYSLSLNGNLLYGHLPPRLGNLSYLEYLNLAANNLNSSIPNELGNCTKLLSLNLSTNQLTGFVPPEIGDLKALMSLDLSHNFLTADIPREIGGLLFLETLNLSHNSFVGSIPPGLANVLSLRDVNVSYNQLEGPIPDMESFRRAPFEALRNNRDLCGNNSVLNPCPLENPTAKAGKQSDASIIVFPILGGGILLISLATVAAFFVYRRIKARKASTGNEYLQVFAIWTDEAALTYESIIQATESFDSRHQIGSGSSGSVYKAALQSTTKQNQVVAVKKLHDQSGEGVERLKANWRAFRSEIRALTNIKHRNIVKLYGFFSNAQHSLLVYEFMERGSLRSVLDDAEKAKELDWEDRVKIVKGIASALSYMHHDCRPPIVHRDISSNNVLLDLDFEAKLSDFGTARLLRPDDRVSTTSFAAGTYGYMAPGIVFHFFLSFLDRYSDDFVFRSFDIVERAYSKKVDEKWDVYGFGVVALEVIIGKHPGDLISSLTTTTKTTSPSLLKDIIDDRITQPGEDGEVAKGVFAIAKFALACVRAEPSSRPTMQEVTMDMVTFAIPPLTQPFSQVSLEELFALVD